MCQTTIMILNISVHHILIVVTSERISQHKWHIATLWPCSAQNDETHMQCMQDKQKINKGSHELES